MSLHCIVWCCMGLYCWLRRAGCISQDTYLLYLNCHTGQTKYELITLATVLQKRYMTTTENYPTLCWLPTKCRSKQNMMCCRVKVFQMKTIGLLLGGSQCEGLRQKASCDAERALPKPTNPLQVPQYEAVQYKAEYKAASREQTTMFHFCTSCPLPLSLD